MSIADMLHELQNWWNTLLHHAKNGTLPPAPTPGSGPVVVAPVPAPEPVPAPAPAAPADTAAPTPAPAPAAPLPEGVLQLDARGFVQLTDIESERASNPLWANAPKWWAIELDGYPVSFDARSNLTEAKFLLMAGSGTRLAASVVNTAYAMTANPNGFGYTRGLPYDDALSFIGDNGDASGNIVYRGPRPADMKAFIANCNADHAAAVARHDPRASDYIPSIRHDAGNVA